jgi:hypothetical protein
MGDQKSSLELSAKVIYIKYMITVLQYKLYLGEGKILNVIEGEACRVLYNIFDPSPNITYIARQLPCILFIL